MHGVEENVLDQTNPEDYDPENIQDDEARVFHVRVYKDLPKKHHTMKKAKNYEFCNAKKFPCEEPAFCCRKEKINIYIPELPAGLCRLFASQTDRDAKYFRKHIRVQH
ncbi:hypothetical protein PAHAL_6G212000 [Panicum hallii]|uniref:Uncharacterized protein n=1 Tax=Panicum hallii TaxID=206008 RepID=A0A2T8IH14_9POAL|nr:hypothetical protein PAHAL_6G212000 [Panicum hallii]